MTKKQSQIYNGNGMLFSNNKKIKTKSITTKTRVSKQAANNLPLAIFIVSIILFIYSAISALNLSSKNHLDSLKFGSGNGMGESYGSFNVAADWAVSAFFAIISFISYSKLHK